MELGNLVFSILLWRNTPYDLPPWYNNGKKLAVLAVSIWKYKRKLIIKEILIIYILVNYLEWNGKLLMVWIYTASSEVCYLL